LTPTTRLSFIITNVTKRAARPTASVWRARFDEFEPPVYKVVVPFAAAAVIGVMLVGDGHRGLLSWGLFIITSAGLAVRGLERRGWWASSGSKMVQSLCRSVGLGASFGLLSLGTPDVDLKFAAVIVVVGLLWWCE